VGAQCRRGDRTVLTVLAFFALVFVSALAITACGSDGGQSTIAHAPPGRSPKAANAVFDALPRFPGSRAAGSLTRGADGTLVQSFLARGTTVEAVMQYFVDVLPRQGFRATARPAPLSATGERARWRSDGRSLVISAAPAPAAAGANAATDTQYSFLLSPRGVAAP
jgi:hypothetical protein